MTAVIIPFPISSEQNAALDREIIDRDHERDAHADELQREIEFALLLERLDYLDPG